MNPMTALLAIPTDPPTCIEHLERVRCNVDPHYRHFGGAQVARKSGSRGPGIGVAMTANPASTCFRKRLSRKRKSRSKSGSSPLL